MNPQKPIKKDTIFDPKMAERYRLFRQKYIDKNMAVAAEILGLSQSTISYLEAAKRGIGNKATRVMVTKYNLNTKWLTTGEGTEIIEKPVHETQLGKSITDVRSKVVELEAKIGSLEKQISILNANQNHFIKRIEDFLKQQSQ